MYTAILKHSNITIADDGTVEILDFGLAKMIAAGLPPLMRPRRCPRPEMKRCLQALARSADILAHCARRDRHENRRRRPGRALRLLPPIGRLNGNGT